MSKRRRTTNEWKWGAKPNLGPQEGHTPKPIPDPVYSYYLPSVMAGGITWGIDYGATDVKSMEPVEVRDVVEVLAGWREYHVKLDGAEPYLEGARVQWDAGVFEAQCEHGIAIEECLARTHGMTACGVYVLKTMPTSRSLGSGNYITISSWTYTVAGSTVTPSPSKTDSGLYALVSVVCGGVVQKHTLGYRAQQVRIEHIYLIGGMNDLGDLGDCTPDESERIAVALEARYDAPVEIVTHKFLNEQAQKETRAQWLRLAHTSKPYASRFQHELPPLNPRLSAELSDLLNGNQ